MDKILRYLAMSLLLAAPLQPLIPARAQGTAFTYQGRLQDGGNPANGRYDLRFGLFDAASADNQQGTLLTNSATVLSNGLFTVMLDFGNQFSGPGRWLEIAVRTNGGTAFIPLTPRQPLTPTPYAIYAAGASNLASGAVSPSQLNTVNSPSTGQVLAYNATGSLVWTNAPGTGSGWALGGNAGTTAGTHFLGTTDNQPVEIRVNGIRALRVEPRGSSAPSLILGAANNSIAGSALASTIAGGYGNQLRTSTSYAVIGGGSGNAILTNASNALIAGGGENTIDNDGRHCVIGGGYHNLIQSNAQYATISGGSGNQIEAMGTYATIAGGVQNLISTNNFSSTIGGGSMNQINMYCTHATVAGGNRNVISNNSDYAFIGGGWSNSVDHAYAAVVVGGKGNRVAALYSTINGGLFNQIEAGGTSATISGGNANRINFNAVNATIAGGFTNQIGLSADGSVIGGGEGNQIGANSSYGLIGGGQSNLISSDLNFSLVAGGCANTIQTNSDYAAIGGGEENSIKASSRNSTLAGGSHNSIFTGSTCATVGGGSLNQVKNGGAYSAIGGGAGNCIETNGDYGTIPGGYLNHAASYSFAAGRMALATNSGSFVWSDSTGGMSGVNSTKDNSVTFKASGGYRLFSNSGASVGASLAAGSGSWTTMSDRNAKTDFTAVDAGEILAKVVALPLSTWRYKSQDESIRHVGPMAQDFKAAFAVGETDTGISAVDADGVALAAIQGLNQKLEAKNAEIESLKQSLAELKQLVQTLAVQK